MKILSLSLVAAVLLPVAAQAQTFVAVELKGGSMSRTVSGLAVGGSTGLGSASKATIWDFTGRARLLHPAFLAGTAGVGTSTIQGSSGTTRVGFGYGEPTGGRSRAIVWRGAVATMLNAPYTDYFSRATSTDGSLVGGNVVPLKSTPLDGLVAQDSRPTLWNAVTGAITDLYSGTPGLVNGVKGGQQVGYEIKRNFEARLWRGSAASVVNLHPKAYDGSTLLGTDGVHQVGYVIFPVRILGEAEKKPHTVYFNTAGYWSGTAASFLPLDSGIFGFSYATAVSGDNFAGYGIQLDRYAHSVATHALAWVGPSHTLVDLHKSLPANFVYSQAFGVDEAGNICGYAVDTLGSIKAILWRRA